MKYRIKEKLGKFYIQSGMLCFWYNLVYSYSDCYGVYDYSDDICFNDRKKAEQFINEINNT